MADKRYDQFTTGTPTGSRITLHADASTGTLEKCTLQEIINLNQLVYPFITCNQALGSPLINFPAIFTTGNVSSSLALGVRQAFWNAIWLPAGTITGALFSTITTGVFTANNYNGVVLYSISSPNIIPIADTGNNANIWKQTIQAWHQFAFSSPVTVTTGWYMLGVEYSSSAATTAPAIGSFNINNSAFNSRIGYTGGVPFTTSGFFGIDINGTINMGGINTVASNVPIVGVY